MNMNMNIVTVRSSFDLKDAAARLFPRMAAILLRQEELLADIRRWRVQMVEESRRDLTLSKPEVAIQEVAQSPPCSSGDYSRPEAPLAPVKAAPSFNDDQVLQQDRISRRDLTLSEPEFAKREVAQSPPCSSGDRNLLEAPPASVEAAPSINDGQVLQQDRISGRDPTLSEPEIAIREVSQLPPCSSGDHNRSEAPPAPVKAAPLFNDDQVLEKPDRTNVFREERKAETALISCTNDIQPFGVKKSAKEELRCTLCRVSATNKRTFTQHLHGKKHRRREEDLQYRTQKTVMHEELPNKRRKVSSGYGKEEDKQQKFKFWCEKCRVGANCINNMLDHLNGKKHEANHQGKW